MIYLIILIGAIATFCITVTLVSVGAGLYTQIKTASATNQRGSLEGFLYETLNVVAKLNEHPSLQPLIDDTRRKLVLSDLSEKFSPTQFIALVQLCSVAAALVLSALFAVSGNLGIGTLIAGIAAAMITFWLGLEWLNNKVSERRTSLSRSFPYFLDLSVMTMEAGSSMLETMEIYIRDNPPSALTEELTAVLSEVKMGATFEQAMSNFEQKISAEDVQATVRAILQGQRMGTPLGNVVRDQAETIRFKRSQRAETAAEEIKVKMQGPAMLLMMSVLLLILGPALIGMFDSGVF